ncbi:MAG TPA: DPP IV N-terminal domain-containing protein, partial [Capsulimonadaceae bacterium]|nr:DPP IV N-terminal domain-containing protein [Capsulimonadaceae bacterium]
MPRQISRRQFLRDATVAGSATLLSATSAFANTPPPKATAAAPRPYKPTRAEITTAFQQQQDYDELAMQPVYKLRILPHWLNDNERFWYSNRLADDRREYILVNAAKGMRAPAFDHAKLAAALSRATGNSCAAGQLPFDSIDLSDDGKTVGFVVDDTGYRVDLNTYALTKVAKDEVHLANNSAGPGFGFGRGAGGGDDAPGPSFDVDVESPNGSWTAFVKDHNLYVRDKSGAEKALSTDGTEALPYGRMEWAPDSSTVVAYKIDFVPLKKCYMIESSPRDNGTRGVLHQHEYAQGGDPFSSFEMWLFDPSSATAAKAQTDAFDGPNGPPDLHWSPDAHTFLFERPDRGQQYFKVTEIDSHSGQSRDIVHETTKTFINTSNAYVYYTKDLSSVIYAAETEGWRRLYLYDVKSASLKNRITQGNWVVRAVDHVDEPNEHIYFQGSGKNAGEDPYFIHLYRVNFDGTNLVQLTDGVGTHAAQYSPDRKYLIDTYSTCDTPPTHTLRRVADGSHVCDLEKADASELMAKGWRPPEAFVAKGRDGKTDIYGVVFKPLRLDPTKKYPIIENIYAGPQDSFVRKGFSSRDRMQSLAELGFIVVQCDGMGTRNRSKAFHDVCWKNLKDAGFPDRIAWMKALAAKYPYCDTKRVGIYGTSAGGQNSTGAVLFHPEFYKVAVSSCGCHDNRIDKQWWNEQWMGYPLGPWYADSSNIEHAANLRGKLMLFYGELDTNVPPESTIRLTD